MLILLRQVNMSYNFIKQDFAINLVNFDINFNRNYLFERSTQGESMFFNLNPFHQKFFSKINLVNTERAMSA